MTTRELYFSVTGRPAPQGSKRWVGTAGRPRLIEQSKYVGPWREAIHDAALWAMKAQRWETAGGPCVLHACIYLQKPAKTLFDGPTGRNTGDLDKHARALCDALVTAGVVADDSQFMDMHVAKRWGTPGAEVAVFALEPPYAFETAG